MKSAQEFLGVLLGVAGLAILGFGLFSLPEPYRWIAGGPFLVFVGFIVFEAANDEPTKEVSS